MINRRSFFKSLALIGSALSLSPTIFIPKFEPIVWKPSRILTADFAAFLVDQTPVFDELIMRDIRPADGWLLNVDTATFTPEMMMDQEQSVMRRLLSVITPTKLWTP